MATKTTKAPKAATAKQVAYLQALIADRAHGLDEAKLLASLEGATVSLASALITALKAKPFKAAAPVAVPASDLDYYEDENGFTPDGLCACCC